MGIVRFFGWLKSKFAKHIKNIEKGQDIKHADIDILMIDLNGLFHSSTQKIYQYGTHKPPNRLMNTNKKKQIGLKEQLQVFDDICKNIEKIVIIVKPKKSIVLCVDGPAPLAKQCLTGDTLVTMSSGISKPIKEIEEGEYVLGWNGKGYTSTINLGLETKGEKNVLKITTIDGKILKCTPDHRILVLNNNEKIWKQAGDLSNTDVIVAGITAPIDIFTESDSNWVLYDKDGVIMSMKNEVEKNRSLILARLYGYIIADGYNRFLSIKNILGHRPKTVFVNENIEFATKYDAIEFANDVYVLTGKMVENTLPVEITNLMSRIGKGVIPEFLLKKHCPLLIIKEFLAGLSGGDRYKHMFTNNFGFIHIDFSQRSEKDCENIIKLLDRFGIKSVMKTRLCEQKTVIADNYNNFIVVGGTFWDKIGVRYHINKNLRLMIATSYYNYIKTTKSVSENISTYLKKTNTMRWFSKTGAMNNEDIEIPCYYMPILDIVGCGVEMVYDIEVEDNHSFLANGLCVHNCQQRKRRYKSASESTGEGFDSNSLTPGTKYMDFLTKYIDWYIHKRISEDDNWKNIDVIFSSEKAEGEGEQKLLSYTRKFGSDKDVYCINGMDADLIMLALITHRPNFYILRENTYENAYDFFLINIGTLRLDLAKLMDWRENESEKEREKFNSEYAINDFVLMLFSVGNDFLAHIPSLEIIEGGVDHMLDIYKKVGKSYGHLTESVSGNIFLSRKNMQIFFGTIALYDKGILEEKMKRKDSYFPDALLSKHCVQKDAEKCFHPSDENRFCEQKYSLNIEEYKSEYYRTKFNLSVFTVKDICHQYLEGLQWVLTYYTRGVPDWKWCYKHHYAPFAHELAEHIQTFNFPKQVDSSPSTPFQQLLCVIPPKSSNLIPIPICQLLTDSISKIKQFCPTTFDIDLSGKKNDWEAVVLLPMVDFEIVREEYFKHIGKVDQQDLYRNILQRSRIYSYSSHHSSEFKSFYGNIQNCCVKYVIIDL